MENILARQPILDKELKTVGYELFFRENENIEKNSKEADQNILINLLHNFGQDEVIKDKLSFLNITTDSLVPEILDLLNPKLSILEINAKNQLSPQDIEKIKNAKNEGFVILMDGWNKLNSELFLISDFLKISALAFENPNDLLKAVTQLKNANQKIKIIIQQIEKESYFNTIKNEKNITFFQGFFYARPETIKSKVIPPNLTQLINIINLTKNGADIKEIEIEIKKDVATSFKLLRYINSAGFGLSCEITSFRHAVTILGYQKLYKWATLLLTTANKNSSDAIIKNALIRGKFMELLGEPMLNQTQKDDLFITGTFSLLDCILNIEIEEALTKINLASDINDAILHNTGVYAPYLEIAKKIEIKSTKYNIPFDISLLGITENLINSSHLEAIKWTEELFKNT